MDIHSLLRLPRIATGAVLLTLLSCGNASVSPSFSATPSREPPAWPDDPYVQRLVEQVLPETSEDWDGHEFAQQGSRGATYIALGLLWRDGTHDRSAAASILRGVLRLQYDDGPDSKLHGVWRRRHGEADHDSNWREFVGCGLILILETFPDRLPGDLVSDIQAALLRAADGTARRNVGAGYTNIALMSAFLLDYVGSKQGHDDLRRAGQEKAEAIYDLFSRHKTFDEYNSPTYYGADLMALALWREHACSERMRELGRLMEADLWRDIGMFYHAGMRNICGPFVRAYGMDMTKYPDGLVDRACSWRAVVVALALGGWLPNTVRHDELCFLWIAGDELRIGHWATGELEEELAVARWSLPWAHDDARAAAVRDGPSGGD